MGRAGSAKLCIGSARLFGSMLVSARIGGLEQCVGGLE